METFDDAYDDVLEQIFHELKLCKARDDIHEADDLSNMKLSDKVRQFLDNRNLAILEKYPDE